MGAWGETNDAYVNEILIPQTVKAAVVAFNNLKPALMGIGVTESNVGVNRREIDENGNVILGQNPFGVFDKTMTVLSFKGLEGGAHNFENNADDIIVSENLKLMKNHFIK